MSELTYVKVSKLKTSEHNPRTISKDKLAKLVQSIIDFPEMLEKRPLIVDENNVVLGGNMRLAAAKEIGLKEVPVIVADGWTEEQKKQFIIKDNVSFGQWDWDKLANEWDNTEVEEWGLDVWNIDVNSIDEIDLDLDEEFDPIGTAADIQRVVFIFDGEDEAESYLAQFPELPLQKRNMAWQVNLSTKLG
jgi:hypothetical protein